MARGTQFNELIDMLRAEVEQSLNRNVGLNALDGLKYRLRNAYLWLWQNYDWSHLKIYRDEQLRTGERYYSFDADFDIEGIEKVWVLDGDQWVPVGQGISPEHYNIHAEGDRYDPVQRWDIRENDQYEVWPTPASDGRLRMYGVRKFVQMREEKDVCQLDDLLVVLFAAAAILAKAGSPDAQMAADKAVAHLNKLRGKARANKGGSIVIGGGVAVPQLRPGLDYVAKA